MIQINHFTDFYNLINAVGLASTPPFDNFIKTVRRYIDLCGCDRASEKAQAQDSSRKLYTSLAKNEISSYISMIKAKKNTNKVRFFNENVFLVEY